ncbi:MAG TPA: AAA family ATPase [Candidatus Limnocylindrales bacterium]|nr:AAA family ATPase [Candidatus Limnocylindrales bacterium]
MRQIGPLLAPVIVGRDEHLALAERRLGEVLAGHGQLLLVSGEAGIGKSRLLGEIAGLAAERGFRIARAEVAPQDHDVLAASLLDLGRSMRRDPAFGSIGRDLLEVAASRLNERAPRRRDFVNELIDLLGTPDKPTVLVFEDVQWADDLSLETLTELARQTRDQRLLIVAAYRTSEALLGSVLREWRSRLVTQRIAEEVRLGRLSREETAEVIRGMLGMELPAPRDVVDAIYARTDGVPLHIEELCSALGRERLADSAAVLEAAVPETLEDATLTRMARLSPEAQAVARAGAVIGRSFVPSVLAGIMNLPMEALDAPIEELVDHDILDAVHGGAKFDFRHQLLRDALYRSVPAGDRRRFHARAAEFGSQLEGATDTHASVHYERAGMTDEAFRTALAAGEQAMRLASHREAFVLLRRAVDNMPASLPESERARILLLFADANGNIDANADGAELAMRARELARRAGNMRVALEASFNLNDIARREGASLTTRRDLARTYVNEIRASAPGDARDFFLPYGLHLLALVEWDDNRFAGARALLAEADELVTGPKGERPSWLTHALAKFDVIEGHVADGLAAIRASAVAARSAGDEDTSISRFRDLALFAMRAMDYRQARAGIFEGLRYAESVEQTSCGHSLTSCDALVSWAEGRWDEALRQGGHALSDVGAGASKNMAQQALGYVEAGRGRRREAEEHLRPALEYARRSERLDLILPALWGLAEAALHGGDPAVAAAYCDEALRAAEERGERTLIAPFAPTAVRAHQAAGAPEVAARYLEQFTRLVAGSGDISVPSIQHATGLVRLGEGSTIAARVALESAVASWDERGRRWEALWARLDLAAADLRSSRFVDATKLVAEVRTAATELGSAPLLARAEQLARTAKGRGAEQEPWHPLTTREFEVARKVAEGLTNAELADDLAISPKTASSHVEHILAKLGVSRRAEIAAWATSVVPTGAADRSSADRSADRGVAPAGRR